MATVLFIAAMHSATVLGVFIKTAPNLSVTLELGHPALRLIYLNKICRLFKVIRFKAIRIKIVA